MNNPYCYARVNLLDAPHIPPIIKSYLRGDLPNELFSHFPDDNGLVRQANIKAAHFPHRQVLMDVLTRQYQHCNTTLASKEKVQANIDALKHSNTLTVTTGHQACLGAGPLFSIYKIISCIITANALSKKDKIHNYVPVFWMATEDHDWEEANHFFMDGKKWTFDKAVDGPVGRASTDGMQTWLDVFSAQLPSGEVPKDILKHLKNAYLAHSNWADATRQWAHDLFAEYGLVVIDGDDRDLKRLFIPVMERELFSDGFSKTLTQAAALLSSAGFGEQAHPADVNLFFLGNGIRQYPERVGEGFQTEQQTWTRKEFMDHLHNMPEDFSPNVILRPVYQECILPNVAYFGGPGELAYWFQLKGIFDAVSIPFPVLMLRNGFALMDSKSIRRYETLDAELLFLPPSKWKDTWVKTHSPLRLSLDEEKRTLITMFENLAEMAGKTDASMIGAVNAQRAKQLKGLSKLEKKLLRAEKRQHTESMEHIDKLHHVLYPAGVPQERHDSLWMWWINAGGNPIKDIIAAAELGTFAFLRI